MATSPHPSHPHADETVAPISQDSRHGPALVLFMTMVTTLLIGLATIALTANHASSVPTVANAMLAMA